MNTRRKGRKNELRARDILVAAGYDVCVTKSPSKFSEENDLFGLWDLIAVSATEIRFVQVKSNRNAPKDELEAMREWVCPAFCSKEVWIFHDRDENPTIKPL